MRHGKTTILEASKFQSSYYKAGTELNLYDHIEVIRDLVRLAKTYNRMQENACNYDQTEAEEKREKSLEKRISHLAKIIQLEATFSGDPRGFCVKLHKLDKSLYNTWGGPQEGYGIGETE